LQSVSVFPFKGDNLKVLKLQEQKLELQDNVFDIEGFFTSREETIYTVEDNNFYRSNPSNYSAIMFTMHPDKVTHQRSVYTYFDWLGDIGGL
jgi:hypothetical protein